MSVSVHPDAHDLELAVEVSWAGSWYTLNDHVAFICSPEGFGVMEQTYRRKEVTSEYFEGSYTVHKVRESTKRTLEVWVHGMDQAQVTDNILRLVQWFTEDEYNVRIRLDDHQETWLCGAADYRIDRSHVLMHNQMAKVTLTIGVNPRVLYEVVL